MAYSSIREIIDKLNASGEPYLILRNFDNLYSEDIFMEGHGDIDILCAQSDRIAHVLGLQSSRPDRQDRLSDGTHFHTYVGDRYVSMDLRHVGDGYYCTDWQEEMLRTRILHSDGFFIMNSENLFYSLVYHAILQKKALSEEYRSRLETMAKDLGISLIDYDSKSFISILNKFLTVHNYCFTYTEDKYVPCRFHLVDKKLVKKNPRLYLRHLGFNLHVGTIDLLVKIKHVLHL